MDNKCIKCETYLGEYLGVLCKVCAGEIITPNSILDRVKKKFPYTKFFLIDKGHFFDLDVNGRWQIPITKDLSDLYRNLKLGNPDLSRYKVKEFIYEYFESQVKKALYKDKELGFAKLPNIPLTIKSIPVNSKLRRFSVGNNRTEWYDYKSLKWRKITKFDRLKWRISNWLLYLFHSKIN